ncbi:hypothetical protein M378DRAFT_169468 [Amanita muscaria Koide BX008]|uniref:Uncharacterized protein n=1 Tax=Amanita muscaria (strain Koide BX008) TaxID=946122 RepID=A0A0C2WRC9_AMAMK|nr:hypothetical protein M378DRAFT_169468 [Amanita muscaria Koide BX008]
MIFSLASGLLDIGSRFNCPYEAASMFLNARDTGMTLGEFVDSCRNVNKFSTSDPLATYFHS